MLYNLPIEDFSSGSVPKQVQLPVWHEGPVGKTVARTQSRSQSARNFTTFKKFPLVSPFVQSSFLERLQNVNFPVSKVFSKAFSFAKPCIKTSPFTLCAITGIIGIFSKSKQAIKASFNATLFVYKAIPSWTSQCNFSNSLISGTLETPPATTTLQWTASLSCFTYSIFVPCIQPSFSTQVNNNSEQNFSACFAPSTKEISIVSVQPFTAIFPLIASTEIIILSLPIACTNSFKNSSLRTEPFSGWEFQAAEPIITFSAPRLINSFARFTVRIPPPVRTFPLWRRLFNKGVFTVLPFASTFPKAASKSITATSPYKSNWEIRASASSRCKTSSFQFFNWTTCPFFKSIDDITISISLPNLQSFYKWGDINYELRMKNEELWSMKL